MSLRPDEQHYGPLFWTGLTIGGAVMAYAVWGVLADPRATKPLAWGAYIVGLASFHDLILAPIVYLIGTRVGSSLRGPALTAVQAGLIISGTLILFAFPLVFRFGAIPDNPSFLPGNYWAGLGLALAIVWAVTMGVVWRAWRRR